MIAAVAASSHVSAFMPHVECVNACDSIKEQQPHHACPYCRGSFYAKLCFVSRHDTENLFIAEIQQFLRVVNADAEVLRLAVCKLHPAKYGRVEDVMTASLSSRTQQVLAGDTSELDTKVVTATEGTKLFGLVYKKTSGMA